jgi:Transmembrane Fragile-X-F protein.
MFFVSLLIILLGVLFIGLKLSGKIHWSWVWVLCPLWIFPALAVVGAVAVFILGSVA